MSSGIIVAFPGAAIFKREAWWIYAEGASQKMGKPQSYG